MPYPTLNVPPAKLVEVAGEMLELLQLIESEYGYDGTADTCECGENEDGVLSDGRPCEHRRVRAVIAKATNISTKGN